MELTTLCYVERQDKVLLMHRTRKQKDENEGKWIGVGGHLEPGESPDECVRREVAEECGLPITQLRLRGILTFILPKWDDEIAFLYTACSDQEALPECPEGELAWIPWQGVPELNLWPGDRAFLPLLRQREDCFSMKLIYDPADRLTGILLDGAPLPLP